MKLGVLLAGRRPEDIALRFQQAGEAGFFLCQLNIYQSGLTRPDLLAIANASVEAGVRICAIGCYVNPMRPDEPGINGANVGDLEVVLHALDILGARRIVMWSGTHADGIYDSHPDNDTEDSLDLLREFLIDVVRNTRCRHYFIVLEPWRTHVLNSEEKITRLHTSLPWEVAQRVRYVLDAANLMTRDRYAHRNEEARTICSRVGPLAGVVHLRDVLMPPDGEEALPGPGQGALNYPAYIRAILESAHMDAPVIVRNVPAPGYAEARDYILGMSDRWELT